MEICGLFAGANLIGCRGRSKPATIRVSANPYFTMSGLYLAKELGYFAELGLTVEVKQIVSASQAIALAAGGALDIVFSSSSAALVNAIAKGARLRIVAGREMAVPHCSEATALYGRRTVFPEGLMDVHCLKGKRVAASLDSSLGGFSVDTILGAAGLSQQDLQILRMTRSESISALLSGHMDAIFLSDFSRFYLEVSDQIVQGISLSDVLPYQQISFIVFGATLVDSNQDIGVRFLTAYLHGAKDFLDGKTPKFHDELALANGLDPEVARKACRNTISPDGRIDIPSLRRFIQWAESKGYCAQPIQAEQLVDMRFLQSQPRADTESEATRSADRSPKIRTSGL
jgi:NitT/TauT family transport system substrate-binding protein